MRMKAQLPLFCPQKPPVDQGLSLSLSLTLALDKSCCNALASLLVPHIIILTLGGTHMQTLT